MSNKNENEKENLPVSFYIPCSSCKLEQLCFTNGCGSFQCSCGFFNCLYCDYTTKTALNSYKHYLFYHHKTNERMRGALFGQWIKDKNPFQLRVKTLRGEIFFVEVSRQMKVKEVKMRIGYRYSSPFNEIQAIHSGKILVNEKTIEEYGINEQAFVVIIIKKPKNPQLMLHTFGMGSLYVKIRFDQTLQELKKAIKKSEGWEIKNQILMYEGKIFTEMENEKTLKELHINRTGEFFLMISKQFIDLYQDISLKKCWSKMLSNPILSDTKILEKPAHQLILKLRTKHENIEKLVEQMNQTFDKQQAQLFLNWAYFAELTHKETLLNLFKNLGLDADIIDNSLANDFELLYNQQESKDFKIIQKKILKEENEKGNEKGNEKEEENENVNVNEDENEKNEFTINVHRLVLASRSELYYQMFQSIENMDDFVGDYSGRSISAIKIMIHFLYTGRLQIPKKLQSEEIYQELRNAEDFYQLDHFSLFNFQLKNIKKTFRK